MLSASRSRLSAVLQERSRVLDLVCHNQTTAALTSTHRPLGIPRKHIRSSSAPNPSPVTTTVMPNITLRANPLTAECNVAMSQAAEARERSRAVRKELSSTIGHTTRLQQAAHNSVNESFIKKIAATITLKVYVLSKF